MDDLATTANDRLIARSFLSDSGWSLVSTFVAKATSFMGTIVIARILGSEGYGLYGTLLALINMASYWGNLGIPSALAKYLPEYALIERGRLKSVMATSILVTATAGTVTLALLLGSIDLLASTVYQNSGAKEYFVWAGIVVVSYLIINLGNAFLQGLRLFKDLALRNLYFGIVSVPLTVLFVAYMGIVGAFIGVVLANVYNLYLLARILQGFFRLDQFDSGYRIDYQIAGKLLKYSLPVFVGGLFSIPIPWIANTILAANRGFAEVGVLAAASNLAIQVALITTAINYPLVPLYSGLMAKRELVSLSTLFLKNIKMTWLLTLVIALFMGLNATWIVGLLYGSEYKSSEFILYWMAICVMISAVNNVIGMLILAASKVWTSFLVNSLWAAEVTFLMLVLVPSLGALGVVLSQLAAYLIHSIVQVYITRKIFLIRIHDKRMIVSTMTVFAIPLLIDFHNPIYNNMVFLVLILALWVVNVNPSESKLLVGFARGGWISARGALLRRFLMS